MAQIHPFSAYRYSSSAGALDKLVTQPYDKISPSMQARYLSLSPYNLVRIILGERLPADSQSENVYARAHRHFEAWIEEGVLSRDSEVGVYAYTQEFSSPDGGDTLTRKGFIALGDVENYENRVVHRHEQTLAGPKKDRLELLRHTHAHFGQIFMLYPDPDLAIDRLLDAACIDAPTASVTDEYDTTHRLWRLSSPTLIKRIQEIMSDKKLLIADGHHRYETALAFRNENPDLPGARQVMMTLVNMHSPGLRILATHRVVSNLPSFDAAALIERTGAQPLDSTASLKDLFASPAPGRIRIGIALRNGAVYVIDRVRAAAELDVQVLHRDILGSVLNIDEEAVRNESYLQYVRGIDAAVEKLAGADAQVAFLLDPTTVEQVADVAFSGGVMPQKSTDFYPKLLSGLTIHKF
jgi:uncharacterized protein (DUF1015 family)